MPKRNALKKILYLRVKKRNPNLHKWFDLGFSWWAEVDSNQKVRVLEALNPFIYKGFLKFSPIFRQMKTPLNFPFVCGYGSIELDGSQRAKIFPFPTSLYRQVAILGDFFVFSKIF